MKYDAVVIGAGCSGLGAAAAMAQNGLKVLVIEKQDVPGGFASSFVRGRFEFDTAIHYYFVDFFKPIYEAMGAQVKSSKVPETVRFAYVSSRTGEKKDITLRCGSEEAFVESIEEFFPGNREALLKYSQIANEFLMAEGYMSQKEASVEELEKLFPNYVHFEHYNTVEAWDEIGITKDLQDWMGLYWYTDGPNLKKGSFSDIGLGVPLIHEANLEYMDYLSHGLMLELERVIRDAGGEIWYNTLANRIFVSDGSVKWVETNQGDVIETNQVVAGMWPGRVYNNLIYPASEVPVKGIKVQNASVINESFMTIWAGLDCPPEELGMDNVCHTYWAECTDNEILHKAASGLDGPYTTGCLCFNAAVKDISPEGTTALMITASMRGEALNGITQREYFDTKERVARRVIKSLEKTTGIDIMKHIEEIEIGSPATYGRFTGSYNGSMGYEETLMDCNFTKNACYSDEYCLINGLTFVGHFLGKPGLTNLIGAYQTGSSIAQTVKEEA